MRKILLFVFMGLIFNGVHSQEVFYQTIRGRVYDKNSQIPLIGASIVLLNSNPQVGVITNEKGEFRLSNIQTGRVGLQINYLGYHPVTLSNLVLHSAKELIVNAELEEKVIITEEIVVKANRDNGEAINKMAAVSARAFSVEHTERYAGSRGDVGRMAMNFAGVSGANDSRNDIVIRGNSPSGLLWQLEDVEIANPNHFAFQGTTGGPVGMLNNNTLSNSDFMTGAFPAQFGNAMSGVFDLKMRNGNNEKYEFLAQSGFNGFEFGAEGPFSKNNKASFLANYRYSTLGFMEVIGMDMGTAGVPYYQDVTFKLHFPLKKGVLDIFGIGGKSHIAMLDSKKDESDLYTGSNMDLYNGSDLAVGGISFTRFINEKSYAKIILAGTFQDLYTKIDTLNDNKKPHRFMTSNHQEKKITINAFVSKKFSPQLNTKVGVSINRLGFKMKTVGWNMDSSRFENYYDDKLALAEGINRLNLYSQWVYKFNDRLSLHPGVQLQYLDKTSEVSIEPRMAFIFKVNDFQKINLGYGMHSQAPNILLLYSQTLGRDGNYYQTNTEIEFTKAHHFVAGYDVLLAENLRLKFESYYQYLFNIPIEPTSSSYSALNTGSNYGIDYRDSMVNKGTGRNVGFEITLEKYFSNNYYYLLTTSIFDSKYKGSDNKLRNTAFNGNYVINMLVGKEIPIKTRHTLSFDIKGTIAGGQRKTPIDIEGSKTGSQFETKYFEDKAFSQQFNNYIKFDFKVAYRLNGKRISQEWQIYIENITNHKNPLMESYDKKKQQIETTYQLGVFPMVNYRIYF